MSVESLCYVYGFSSTIEHEFIKVLGLEAWVAEYLRTAYYKAGVGGVDKSKAMVDYRPDFFRHAAMQPV